MYIINYPLFVLQDIHHTNTSVPTHGHGARARTCPAPFLPDATPPPPPSPVACATPTELVDAAAGGPVGAVAEPTRKKSKIAYSDSIWWAIRTHESAAVLGGLNVSLIKVRRVTWDRGEKSHAGRVHGRVRQVPVVERDEVSIGNTRLLSQWSFHNGITFETAHDFIKGSPRTQLISEPTLGGSVARKDPAVHCVAIGCGPRKSRGSTGKDLPPITKVRSTGVVQGMLGELPEAASDAAPGSGEMEE